MQIRKHTCELRSISRDGSVITGYAAVYNVIRDIGMGTLEMMQHGALDAVLADPETDVRAVAPDHDMTRVLGRQSSGTLRLKSDNKGLKFEVDLPDTSYARDLTELVKRGDINGASIGFSTPEDGVTTRTIDGKTVFVITSVNYLRDVSPVSIPAYPETSVSMRSISFPDGRSQLIAARVRVINGR